MFFFIQKQKSKYLSVNFQIENDDDGFPQKICALCISYLKHAVNFRQQAIKNILSLKTAKEFNSDKTQESEAKTHIEKIVFKENLRNLNLNSSQKKNNENQPQIIKEKTYFDYSQKSFVEDDITLLDIFQNNEITFNIPEHYKERKCIYCRRLFMFEESYEEHIRECIQATLQLFTKQITNLTELKENREISPHEFIRRMIYCLKKNAQTLNEYSEDIFKFSVQDNEIFEENLQDTIKIETNKVTTSTPKKIDESSNLNNLLLNRLCRNMNSNKLSLPDTVQNIFPSAQFLQKTKCRHCQKLFENISELERHNQIYHQNPIKIDGNISELIELIESQTDGFIDLLDIPQKQNFVKPIAFRKSNQEFNLNQNQLNYRSEFQVKNLNDENKFVKCTRCNAKFLTITHLDEHVFKNHTTSKKITNF